MIILIPRAGGKNKFEIIKAACVLFLVKTGVFRFSQINLSRLFRHHLARLIPRSRDARQQKPLNFSKNGNPSPRVCSAYTSAHRQRATKSRSVNASHEEGA